MKTINIRKLLIFFSLILLAGCMMKEDLSECGIWLRFDYILNPEHIDKFTTEVNKIKIFVFDLDTGILIDEFEEEGPFTADYRYHLMLPTGKYEFVVWGNLSDETPITTGLARTNDRLELKTSTPNVVETHPQPIYFGSREYEIKNLNNQEILIPMMKDMKTVQVILNGIPGTEASAGSFVVRIEANDGDYDFHNNPLSTARKLTYLPEITFNESEHRLTDEFVTMRLYDYNTNTNTSLCGSRLIIEYIHTDGTVQTLYNVPLTEEIKKRYPNVNFIVDDFFVIEFDIDFTFGNFGIKPAGWEHENQGGGIIG